MRFYDLNLRYKNFESKRIKTRYITGFANHYSQYLHFFFFFLRRCFTGKLLMKFGRTQFINGGSKLSLSFSLTFLFSCHNITGDLSANIEGFQYVY